MTTSPGDPLRAEDMKTVSGSAGTGPGPAYVKADHDGADADGTDAVDTRDADGTDADGTDAVDTRDADGTDADGTDA